MKWSQRVEADRAANRLTRALETRTSDGRPILDLTLSNPTAADLVYPHDLLAPLAAPGGLLYRPEPLGLRDARRAVAADYHRRNVVVSSARVVLTASTSEAYSLLFKVLCDPHDEVLVPRPSYPLFEHLTRLDAVTARFYDLDCDDGWAIDVASMERAWSPATRAVLIVSPNNPTGSCLTASELDRLAALCAARGCALIVDEVFADYALDVRGAGGRQASVLHRPDVLGFSLGGLSKSVGLPQVKLAWIAASGPDTLVAEALARLELAADTYLSVSTPVQLGAAILLERGAAVRQQIQARVRGNYEWLAAAGLGECGCTVLRANAGWYAVVRVPAVGSEEDLVLALLDEEGVLAHPGYFFDFPREAYLVVSLLPAPHVFRDGVTRIARHFACKVRGA